MLLNSTAFNSKKFKEKLFLNLKENFLDRIKLSLFPLIIN